MTLDSEARQRAHYDRIAADYEAHYSDPESLRYRRRFINEALAAGVPLEGRRVLDAMCGSGQMAAYLVERGADVLGLDVSPQVIEQFNRKLPQATGVCRSMLDSGIPDESLDAVFVVGGLHHMHPHTDEAVDEIHRILKPGGHLCFAEPHAGSIPDAVRRVWYRFDPLFESNEAAVDMPALERANRHRFDFEMTRYTGGPAYLLVYNSMVFRVPKWLKRAYARPLLWLDGVLERVQGPRTSCMVVARWRKVARPST